LEKCNFFNKRVDEAFNLNPPIVLTLDAAPDTRLIM